MEQLGAKATEIVFSQAGGIGLLLLIAVIWFARQLSMERKEHAKTREKNEELAEKAITSSVQVNETLTAMRSTIELLAGFVRQGGAR